MAATFTVSAAKATDVVIYNNAIAHLPAIIVLKNSEKLRNKRNEQRFNSSFGRQRHSLHRSGVRTGTGGCFWRSGWNK
jgi:hypothetical protein